ncbi:MAG: ABC transporter permease subunit [Vicinamibacterales bacterium]|nr:ABC transporter permease subunit [Vicinamibacterales bacterium]
MTSALPTATPAAPSYWTASRRVFELSLGEMLWSRRTIFMALVVGGPVILAIVFRLVEWFGLPALRVNGVRVEGAAIFGVMIWMLFVRFIVPVLGVFYGTALMADEVEDKTITYLFTRPIPRGAVLLGKYLAYLACTILVVLPSVMLVYFAVVPFGQIPATFGQLVADLGILAAGLAVYGALFAFIGAWLKRPVLVGLVFAFGWEPVVVALPGYLKQFTVAYYLQALVPHTMPSDGAMSVLQSFFQQAPPLWVSLAWLTGYLVVFLVLAARIVERKEYVLEQ